MLIKEDRVWNSLTRREKKHILLWYYTQQLDKENRLIDRRTNIGKLLAKLRQTFKDLGIDTEITEITEDVKQ